MTSQNHKPKITKLQDHRGRSYLQVDGGPILKPETVDKVVLRVERRKMEAVFRDNLSNTQRKKLGLKPIKKS